MRYGYFTPLLAALVLGASACGGDDDNGPGDPDNGSMRARVNGTQWTATAVAAVRNEGIIGFSGTSGSASSISFGVPATGPGTYTIPEIVGMNANYGEFATGYVWQALGLGSLGGTGTATMEIETLNASRIKGTFRFTAPAGAASGATGTKEVTDGEFDIEF